MNRSAMALALSSLVLVGVILVELTGSSSLQPEAGLGQAAALPDAGVARDLAGGGAMTVSQFLERPLFWGERRPAADGEANATAGTEDLPRLTGILLSSDQRRAIFQPAELNRAIVVVVGDRVGNWRVEEIVANAVTLKGPQGMRRLETKFSANTNVATPLPPPANMSSALPGGPLFGGVGAQQNSGMDQPRGKH